MNNIKPIVITHHETHGAYSDLVDFFEGIVLMNKLEEKDYFEFSIVKNSHYYDNSEHHRYFVLKYEMDGELDRIHIMSTPTGYRIDVRISQNHYSNMGANIKSILKGSNIKYRSESNIACLRYVFDIGKENFDIKKFMHICKIFIKYFKKEPNKLLF